jgi:hypothetical protein
MQRAGSHLAAVRDGGQVLGVVALEDVLGKRREVRRVCSAMQTAAVQGLIATDIDR